MVIPELLTPRHLKEISSLEKVSDLLLTVVFWDRECCADAPTSQFPQVRFDPIMIRSSYGKGWLRRLIPTMLFVLEAMRRVLQIRPDVIHVYGLEGLIAGAAARLVVPCKIVYEIFDLMFCTSAVRGLTRLGYFSARTLERLIVPRVVDMAILASPYFASYYRDIGVEDIAVVENFPQQEAFDGFRKIDHPHFTISFIGEVRYFDALILLIELARRMPDVQVLVAGDGPSLADLRKLASGVTNVAFFGRYRYEQDIKYLYGVSDCIYSVYPTSSQNVKLAIPNKLYESIICETPIIVSRGTKLSEFVEENDVGLSVSPSSVAELVRAVELLRSDSQVRNRMKDSCRRLKQYFVWEVAERNLLGIYESSDAK